MKEIKDNQSIQYKIQQLVRYYRIPVRLKKEEALDTIFTKIKQRENPKRNFIIKWSPVVFTEIAAAMVMLVLALHFLTASVTISGENGENMAYFLPDHSRVVFQGNGNIHFRKYFWKRKVSLEGTAYFEVEEGDRFRVMTNIGSIEVLGTRFLVSEQKDSLYVQCYEGRVKTGNKNSSFILEPGTQYSGTKKRGVKKIVQSRLAYPEFAQFNKNFLNATLSEVIKDLEAFFGTKIDIQNGKERNFSGTIQTGKLESALEIVCQSMQLKYRYIKKNRIVIFK